MLGFPQAQVLDITGPLEVFTRTARWLTEHRGARRPAYVTELVAERAGPLLMSSGLALVATRRYADVRDADTLLVAGGIGWEAATRDRALLAWLAAQARRVQRLGSICNGAMLLAAAGLLDGKPATTHWAYLDRLATVAPRARIDRDALYVRAGNLYTSAGVTAGMDLALALVEQDHGKAVALAVAQELVLFLKRPGGQSQFSRYLEAQRRDDLFGELELWMLENPRADLSVEALARRMSMSPRHFARLFRARLGATRVIVYGSVARGEATVHSDVDLLVVAPSTEKSYLRMANAHAAIRDLSFRLPISPLVLTPEELAARLERGDAFIREIVGEGVEL